MDDLLTYFRWRGDLSFSDDAPNEVDALIFSALSYLRFSDAVSASPTHPITLKEAADAFFSRSDLAGCYRVKNDLLLLSTAAQTERFGKTEILFYQDILIPEEETQFSAVTFLLSDGTAMLAFRGTDNSIVGWKEDFNMSFCDEVPAQRLALSYIEQLANAYPLPMRLCGHSKGGNLAVFAAARSVPNIQNRILFIYNNDGPGFQKSMMTDLGYRNIVPRVHTFVPQSSVVGMLLEHEEPYHVVRSSAAGIMQHDLYSWELDGPHFASVSELGANSQFLDKAVKSWLEGLTMEERNELVDTVFDLIGTGDAKYAREILRPQNIRNYLRTLNSDDEMRHMLLSELGNLISVAYKTQLKKEDT